MYSSLLVLSFAFTTPWVIQGLRHLPERARGGSVAALHPELLPNSFPTTSRGYSLSVPLDHFNQSDHRHFEDHFFVDDSCFNELNGPVFVEMGGEGPTTGAACTETHRQYGALAVYIEHRFYGNSIPYNDRNVSMLRFLTVEQNLADTADIINFVFKNWSLHHDNHTVVTFGGSYSGATAAWFRMAYPNVTHASISSSGVVNAIVNFTEFDQQVAEAIDLPKAGCAARLQQHVQILENYFAKGEQKKVKARFSASNLIGTKYGDSDFWYMVADGAAMADQV